MKHIFLSALLVPSLLLSLTSPSKAALLASFAPASTSFTESRLIPGDSERGDEFGRAVAVDGNFAVVGAPNNAEAGYSAGAAYVFVKTSSGWMLQQKLTAADASPAFFGTSVAIEGDTIVVGAYGDANAGNYSGAAYVFVRSGSIWNEEQKLTGSDNSMGDGFGISVAINGDTIVCGAFGDSEPNLSEVGSAYVFHKTAGSWVERQKLVASDAMPLNRFGLSVGINEGTIVVGGDGNAELGFYSGAVYVFTFDGSNWIEQEKLHAHDATAGASFGYHLAISGDTIVVGAPQDSVGSHTLGAAYVFRRTASGWSQQKKLVAVDSDAFDGFGLRVAVDGDTIVVGSLIDHEAALYGGAAYVYKREGQSGWSLRQKLLASDAGREDTFGGAVAVSDSTVVIGAFNKSDVAPGAGAAYVYEF